MAVVVKVFLNEGTERYRAVLHRSCGSAQITKKNAREIYSSAPKRK